jgi:glycosyltransferase involved in cell wall biosynthesis
LERTIKSVLEQYHDDYELLLLDDGSTDSTFDIIERYATNNSRIIGYRLDHMGVSKLRNYGVEKASSDIITFLDSDDILYKNSLGERLRTFQDFEKDDLFVGVYCPAKKILINNKSMGLSETFYLAEGKNALTFGDTFKSPFIPSQVLLKKEKFRAAGGFKVDSGLCEDYLLWQELMRGHQYFIPNDKVSIGYTQRAGSVVHSKPYEHFMEFKNVLHKVLNCEDDSETILKDICQNEMSRRAIYTLTILTALGKKEDIEKLENEVGKLEFHYFSPEQLACMFKSACVRVMESHLRSWDTIKKAKEREVQLMCEMIEKYLPDSPYYKEEFVRELRKNPVQISRFNKALKKYNKLSSQNKFFLWILGFVYTFVVMFFTIIGTYVICG